MQKRDKKLKVSVLVPIYNVENYLEECLDSLVEQTLKDIEIICINDGSTDTSAKIIEEYAEKDERIVVITKKNSGYGDSMNQGVDRAKGEYIGIVESDDWAEPDMFEKMYKAAVKNDMPDVVKSNFWKYSTETGENEKYEIITEDEDGKVVHMIEHGRIFTEMPSIWSAIYNRNFLNKNKIRFLPSPGASYQDIGLAVKTYTVAKRVLLMSDAYLHYRTDNEGSSVNNVDKKAHATMDEYKEIDKFMAERPDLKEYYPLINYLRFANHHWTFINLSPKIAKEYVRKISKEFRKIKDLDFSVFDERNKEMLEKIMENPDKYYGGYRIHAMRQKAKQKLKKIAHVLSPTYRNLEQINDELRDMKSKNAVLLKKLKELENKGK